ncbi:MAG: CoA transferase [Dehalococcoidia bacterium]|nr:CoA transferase [Dehalococcoidia bacterium]
MSPAAGRRPRALDVATGVGASYASRLLAEVGWDVVKVEPPGGDPLRDEVSRWGRGRGGAFAYANYGKRGVLADEGAIERLAGAADVVLGDFSVGGCAVSGVPAGMFASLSPRLAVVSITPFGITGPKADWASTDVIVQAASGLMFLTGEYDQAPQQLPPYAAAITGGIAGAAAALAAARSARADGEVRRVDVAMVEAMATHSYSQTSAYVYAGEVPRREQRVKQALRMVPASDGFVYCAPGAVANVDMRGVAELIGEPRLLEDRFQTAEGRMQHYQEYLGLFVPPFSRRRAQEWFEEAEKLHLTFALVQTIDDLFQCPQLDARTMLRQAPGPDGITVPMPGRPFRMEGGPAEASRPWPEDPGEDTDEVFREWLTPPPSPTQSQR